MSTPGKNYILQRATDTHACMVVIRDSPTDPWEWEEMTAVDFKTKLDAANALAESESDEAADTTEARGLRDQDLEALRDKYSSYLGLAKRKYRKDAAKMGLLTPLKTAKVGVQKTLKIALDTENAWKQIDQAYVPEAGNTFAAFRTSRLLCQTKYEAVSTEGAQESEAGGQLTKELQEIYRLSVDWYQEAFRRFGPETPHGMMIREQIDTGGNGAPQLPGKAVITSIVYENNGATIEFTGTDADTFDVFLNLQATGEFTKVGDNISAHTFTVADTHGDFRFKVVARNAHGTGPESDEATISG